VFDPAAPEATIAEGFARTASLAAECEKRKIPFAFGTGRGAFATAWLRTQAALAVAGGLTRDAALAAVTTRAAEILGVDHEMGALRPGRGANVVLFDGDPFDPSTPVRLTIVEGDILYQR
jgi:imidazolonepropionase-like amidohydrolase